MAGLTAYKCNSRQIREFIIDVVSVGLVPFIRSSPGMGKSSIVRSVNNEYDMELIDHRLSTSAPEDLTGLPHFDNGKASFAPFDIFPTKTTPLVQDKNGWFLFLDEFNSAPKSVQAAAYKLILDRKVGQHDLHERVRVVAAGNLDTDRAIVNPLSTAMMSRLIHLELVLDFDIWMQDVALKDKWDERIIAFLSWLPARLMDFRPDHNDVTFCCPRTWEFMNKLIKGKEVTQAKAALYSGTITSGVATEFITFTKIYENLPHIEDIILAPEGISIPHDRALQYAVITHIMGKINAQNFEALTRYVNRFSSEFKVLFFRNVMIHHIDLKGHPAFRAALGELSRWLND